MTWWAAVQTSQPRYPAKLNTVGRVLLAFSGWLASFVLVLPVLAATGVLTGSTTDALRFVLSTGPTQDAAPLIVALVGYCGVRHGSWHAMRLSGREFRWFPR